MLRSIIIHPDDNRGVYCCIPVLDIRRRRRRRILFLLSLEKYFILRLAIRNINYIGLGNSFGVVYRVLACFMLPWQQFCEFPLGRDNYCQNAPIHSIFTGNILYTFLVT